MAGSEAGGFPKASIAYFLLGTHANPLARSVSQQQSGGSSGGRLKGDGGGTTPTTPAHNRYNTSVDFCPLVIRGRRHAQGMSESKSSSAKRVAPAESADLFSARELEQALMSSGHERPEEDRCPICFLLIELPVGKHSKTNACCMKRVCKGCSLEARRRGIYDICPFCRTPFVKDDASLLAMIQKRADKGDAEATKVLGDEYYHGELGLAKDIHRAVELWTEAAKLGSLNAHHNLGRRYYHGDMSKKTNQGAFNTGSRRQ